MAFDLEALNALVAQHGRVARVVIADIRGSSPRETGAAMLVWDGGQSGTIGGGALEWMASERALRGDRVDRHALGPDLGQCCGGVVTLITEVYDRARLAAIKGPVYARGRGDMPLAVKRILTQARGEGLMPDPAMIEGWFVEPLKAVRMPLWIWGAGHVGRALVDVLAPLPAFDITWVDTGPSRFPARIADGVRAIPATHPALLARHAPVGAAHLILTYSHALDLELCNALLSHDFGFAGLIGSKTKWARFRARLGAVGHRPAQIDRITCPIGQKSLGKHPQAIAVGVAAGLLDIHNQKDQTKGRVA